MPAARHHVRQFRSAHEARVKSLPVAGLLHGAAKQHHRVGGREPDLRLESELALARPELDLDRAQRQPERDDVAPNAFQDRLDLIEACFREILIAGRQHRDFRRFARPGGIGGIEPRVDQLEDMEFDLEPGHVIKAGMGEPVQHLLVQMAGRERHRPAVLEIEIAQHPAGLRRPRQDAKVVGSAIISTSAPPSISGMPKPPPAVNTGNTLRCEVSLASSVVVMVQPLRMVRAASAAITVLPRRMPC